MISQTRQIDIQVKERRGKRIYMIDGEPYDSVTSILSIIDKSGPLIPWAVKTTCDYISAELRLDNEEASLIEVDYAKKVLDRARKEATRQKEEAADIGSIVHHAIHEFVKTGRTPSFDDERATRAWEAFTKWALSVGFEPVRSEQVVFSKKRKFAGTMDIAAILTVRTEGGIPHRRMYCIDVKSSKGFYEDQFGPQIAAYEMCFSPNPNAKEFMGIGILRLDKATGEPHFHDCTKKKRKYRKVFLAALDLYQKIRALKEEEVDKCLTS